MQYYAKVENNLVVKKNLIRKQFGVGEKSDESVCVSLGYYPIIYNTPAIDKNAEEVSVSGFVINEIDKTVEAMYQVVEIPAEELLEKRNALVERTVQKHINDTCLGLGYDDENSIAKYLVVGNPYYTECSALSLWIGDVWMYVYAVQNDVANETRVEPTLDELISELPVYGE